jgi:hypothetical protein
MRTKTFPTEIFVTSENEGTDDAYKQVHSTATDAAEMLTKKRVGRYLLAEVLKVEGTAKVSGYSLQCHPNFRRKT